MTSSEKKSGLVEYCYRHKDSKLGCYVELILDRPKSANSLSSELMVALTTSMKKWSQDSSCRALMLRGSGEHFCSGADLQWMQAASKMSLQENFHDAKRLTELFVSFYEFPAPTIVCVQGSAFGGAVGLVACADIVLADERAQFCLSEAKLGLAPAVIFPYLARRFDTGALRRLSLTSRIFGASDAQRWGLVDEVLSGTEHMQNAIDRELQLILKCGPSALRAIKILHRSLMDHSTVQQEKTAQLIAALRTSEEGQSGLSAFFSKNRAPWVPTETTLEGWSKQS